MGVLELTALPSLDAERWVRSSKRWTSCSSRAGIDVSLPLDAGAGLADLLPSLPDTVWVGVSGGSMVMTPRIGDSFVAWSSATDDRTLGIVDFSIFPHLDNPDLPRNTMAGAEAWAAQLSGPAYAIDDETAIKVVDGDVEVVSEGQWKLLAPQHAEA